MLLPELRYPGLLGEVVAACSLGEGVCPLWALVLHWRRLGVSVGVLLRQKGADIHRQEKRGREGEVESETGGGSVGGEIT